MNSQRGRALPRLPPPLYPLGDALGELPPKDPELPPLDELAELPLPPLIEEGAALLPLLLGGDAALLLEYPLLPPLFDGAARLLLLI